MELEESRVNSLTMEGVGFSDDIHSSQCRKTMTDTWLRTMVVVLYLMFVSLTAIILAVYYSFFWTPIPELFHISNSGGSDSSGVVGGGRITGSRKG